jgi:hypothetical protein
MSLRGLTLATVVSLCSLVGGLSFSAPAALAVTAPVVEEVGVTNVAGTSATLQARINPEGSETTYRFEYGTSEAYGSSVPVPDGLVGSGSVGVAVSAHPQGLSANTTYHYRVLAVVASRSETVPGSDGTFVTQPAGGEFALPDGRQWELVSPPNKHGALIQSLSSVGPIQASEDGSRITYGANLPTELEPPGFGSGAGHFIQVLSVRGTGTWSSRDIATPHSSWTGSLSFPEYRLFSKDLSSGLVYPENEDETLLSDRASEATPYIRRESLCDAPATAGECYLPVLTGKEGFADVPPGTEFGLKGNYGRREMVSFEGASPDLSHVLMSSQLALTRTPTTRSELYEWSAGAPAAEALQLISLLPASEGGGPVTLRGLVSLSSTESAGNAGVRHSVSDNGSRVFWTAASEAYEGRLYMRDTAKQETVRLDVQQPGAPSGGTSQPIFQIASSDGSKVFFTDGNRSEVNAGQRLTAQSGTQGQDLYECEIVEEAGRLACRLTDLTPEREGHPAEVQNLVSGASEDGSYVYFVANSVLSENRNSEGESATQGTCKRETQPSETCNLYEYHNGAITFIATLSGTDEYDWGSGDSNSAIYHSVADLTARVSPDGRYLAFMSDRSLTGYDNRDAVSGKPAMEVYLHDALTGRLACVSCDPTGSRPVGVEVGEFERAFSRTFHPNVVAVHGSRAAAYSNETLVAANLPAGNEGPTTQDSSYLPSALSDGGRVFFNSNDALVSQDVNGQEDVYQFEPEGTGGCVASSATFSPKTGGCVSLISSGTSPEESGFMDASKDGGDVFFLTMSRLTSQDYDTAFDVYDAHECSVTVPCVASPVASPPCASGDACKGAPAPQPSSFGAPASATFAGAGNVAGLPAARVVRPRSLTRAQKLARALKACRKKPRKRRAVCERQARKNYGAKVGRRLTAATRKGQG